MQIVEVEWDDSSAITGWHGVSDFKNYDVAHCRTVGYLLGKDKKRLTILQSIGECSYGESLTIPRSTIKKIVYLKEDSNGQRR